MLGDRLNGEAGPHGNAVNILFEDGHVRLFVLDPRKESLAYEYYVNDDGHKGAGTNFNDIVLASSSTRPFPPHMEKFLLAEPALTPYDEYLRKFDFRTLNTGSVLQGSDSTPLTPWYLQAN